MTKQDTFQDIVFESGGDATERFKLIDAEGGTFEYTGTAPFEGDLSYHLPGGEVVIAQFRATPDSNKPDHFVLELCNPAGKWLGVWHGTHAECVAFFLKIANYPNAPDTAQTVEKI